MSPLLAIIIPAFKARYLELTLKSFATQTASKDSFRIYIADDASPEDLQAIVQRFTGELPIIYTRFANNLGHRSLVQHWDRAIQLSTEKWIWLFSDDDEVEPETIEGILERIRTPKIASQLLRIPLRLTTSSGKTTRDIEYPIFSTAQDFLYECTHRSDLYCAIQNFVFTRERYVKVGGFVDLPGGMLTDLASWPRFARNEGVMRTLRGSVRFREHDESISGGAKKSREKRRALISSAGAYFTACTNEYTLYPPPHPECPGLEIICALIAYYPDRLRPSEMLALRAQAKTAWPGMSLRNQCKLWGAMFRPWLRAIRRRNFGTTHE